MSILDHSAKKIPKVKTSKTSPGRHADISSKSLNYKDFYSPFCVPVKVTKLIGLTRPPFLSPTNLVTFARTQNGE
jgi:hypothetical protein